MRWKHHPAVLMWKEHEFALRSYVYDMCEAWIYRGFEDTITEKICRLRLPNNNKSLPPWMGDERIHSSHRSRLLFKGYVDSLIKALQLDCGVSKPGKWLKENGYPKSNAFTLKDAERLNCNIFDELNTSLHSLWPNHYHQFKWKETEFDGVPYYWPVTIDMIRKQEKDLVGRD